MARTLYELAAADTAIRFSPYCWRTRFALAHKGLPVEAVPWHFTQKDRIAFSGQDRVPVLVDGETVVSDSWEIARYLERTYPDTPSLFGGAGGVAHALFINAWADQTLQAAISRLIVADIVTALRPEDQGYFRDSRERLFRKSLEAVVEGREERVVEFRADPASPYHDKAFAKDKTLVVYCASGGRSALAGKTLKDLGYDRVFNLGAFKDWADSGGAVDKPAG